MILKKKISSDTLSWCINGDATMVCVVTYTFYFVKLPKDNFQYMHPKKETSG